MEKKVIAARRIFEKEKLLTQYTFEDTIPAGIYGLFSIDFKEPDFRM